MTASVVRSTQGVSRKKERTKEDIQPFGSLENAHQGQILRQSSVLAGHVASMTTASDEELIADVRQGDNDALALLFQRHARVVRGIAYRVLRDAAEADDLLQEVFLLIPRLCRNFDPNKASGRFWILQMTYRRAISRRRYLVSRHFYNTLELEEVSESLQGERGKTVTGLDEQLITRDILQEILPELSEDQQETLRLYFYDGYTFEEIAAKLGQTTGNVSHHYYRGLQKLRRCIFDGRLWNKRAL